MQRLLEGAEGVIEAKVDFKVKKAWVFVIDESVTDEALLGALSSSGRFSGKVLRREPVEQ